jgi:hypothetical protein
MRQKRVIFLRLSCLCYSLATQATTDQTDIILHTLYVTVRFNTASTICLLLFAKQGWEHHCAFECWCSTLKSSLFELNYQNDTCLGCAVASTRLYCITLSFHEDKWSQIETITRGIFTGRVVIIRPLPHNLKKITGTQRRIIIETESGQRQYKAAMKDNISYLVDLTTLQLLTNNF